MSGYVEEPIAIIGSGCRFPGGASSPSKLWELIKEPHDVASKIDRFHADAFYHKDGSHHGTSNVLHAYMLAEDTRRFDTQFFGIPSSEADSIDPQQRLLLEVVYEAVEASGHKIEDLAGSQTAAYVGVMCNDYAHITYHDLESLPKYVATGTAASILSNRISYFFNWTGPSMTIDTACSSSLIATHQAVQSLRKGESNLAVAAGTNLIFGPTNFVAESNVQMLSPTGRSRMWDSQADGYARGEGVAAVLLKRLSDAIADGDTIECIIRETGTNQDGRTPGITMPSSVSQANLIRQTYARAGLSTDRDRCQYFEAHGTGTKAGDPQEAAAIYQAFFGDKEDKDPEDVLYVGSIKTIIGHTEGTAGLAGLLKASLSVQTGTIFPNMLFEELNPDIEPYYGNFEILKGARPWPKLPPGVPRRASVNSFGFGGANAHAIIESYEPAKAVISGPRNSLAATPFVFSGNSEKALATQIETYLSFLDSIPEGDGNTTNLRDLAWTQSRRSAFALRSYCSALDLDSLRSKLTAKLEAKKNDDKPLGWARMGYRLIETSPFAARLLQHLDNSLQSLAEQDRPAWPLKEELSKPADTSHVMEAAYSQPLCTAVQVVLVSMLAQAGVTFNAVVGHSSGEIAAAFAAGFLTAWDAIRIAYYRGLFGKIASGPGDSNGSMLAAGTSGADATELCELPTMARYGRFNVAAQNSSASVTLSGDQKAIERAQFIFEDEGKFVRKLMVDTAYHSHHMEPCAQPYMDAMARATVEVAQRRESCHWFSSVLGGVEVTSEMEGQLRGSYWRDNLLQPVLFSQALESALETVGAHALVLEVGAHAALKGPASLRLHDVEAFSESLGAVWANVGASAVDLGKIDLMFCGEPSGDRPLLLKEAPGYAWDHSQTHWAESRISRALRMRPHSHHELLGTRLEVGSSEIRWRNFLKPSELPWVKGHQIQGQIIFPGAGFAVMAIEACKALIENGTQENDISLIELQDLTIRRAVSFQDEVFGVESVVTLSNIQRHDAAGLVQCDFLCETCPSKDAPLSTASTATIILHLGPGAPDTLPPRSNPPGEQKMTDVDHEVFYNALAKLGYHYSHMFEGITTLRRSTQVCSGVIHVKSDEPDYQPNLILHPAPLDVAFQGIFGALGAPGDGQLWTLMVPMVIHSIRVNPFASQKTACLSADLSFDAGVGVGPSTHNVSGDVDVFNADGSAVLQIERLHVTSVTQITAKDDIQKISETVWDAEKPDAARHFSKFWEKAPQLLGVSSFIERSCCFYIKQLVGAVPVKEWETLESHSQKYLSWAASVVEQVASGTHATLQKEYLNDTPEEMESLMELFAEKHEQFRYLMTWGKSLIPFVRGQISFSEIFSGEEHVLRRVYEKTFGVPQFTAYLGELVQQLVQKSRQMEILKIEIYRDQSDKFIYKTFDVEDDATTQGLVEQGYDLVIASGALHATKDPEKALVTIRKLLKPGGHLLLLDFTDTRPVRETFTLGSSPDWWEGGKDGRIVGSLLSQDDWNILLKQTGFSGIDTATPETGIFSIPLSLMLSQAVDVQMNLIRQPLVSENTELIQLPKLLVLAGQTELTHQLQGDVLAALKPFFTSEAVCQVVDRLEDLRESHFGPKQVVLSFMELDISAFNPFTPERWAAMQLLTEKSINILWLTKGVAGDNPYSNMMFGVARCLVHEKSNLRFQLVDFETGATIDPSCIAEILLRMQISSAWKSFMQPYSPTWVLEREIRVVDGQFMIPRCVPSRSLDARYNSVRRTIRTEKPLDSSTVAAAVTSSGCEFLEVKTPEWVVTKRDDRVDILVHCSSMTAKEVPSVGSLYLIVGRTTPGQDKVLAFSETLQSKVTVPMDWVLPIDVADQNDMKFLVASANMVLSNFILSHSSRGTSLLVHEPTRVATAALKKLAIDLHAPLRLSTASKSRKNEDGQLHYIHPSAHRRTIWELLPRNLSTFFYFPSAQDSARTGARIEEQLPPNVRHLQLASYSGENAYVQPQANPEVALHLLQQCRSFFNQYSGQDMMEHVRGLSLADIPGYRHNPEDSSLVVVNWTAQKTASVKLSPTEDEVRFRSDKTYWLAGLTGDLGLTLTRWMVQRGARYVVMSSRNPKVDEKWLEAMKAAGASITLHAMDITDEASVQKTYQAIAASFPPIVGVCNGAMVLNDELMAKQSHADFEGTLRPKVDGTRYLDALFQHRDQLDFFIVFSSLAYSTGNIGQASYAAANGFMVSVVEGRRKRGLAGSVLNMAGIYGIGYITRRQAGMMDRLEKMGYSNISEWDYLHFFAEAVLAGKPGSGSPIWEISSAVRPGDPDAENPPPWLDVPRFSYFKRIRRAVAGGDGAVVSVRAQLKEQTTMQGVSSVLLAGLVGNLYKLLGMRPEDNRISPSTSLIELGIDSLVAVDMRTWFTRELDLDLPVLKLLGGATVEDMIEDALSRLSPELIPKVQLGKADESTTDSENEENAPNGDSETESDPSLESAQSESGFGTKSTSESDFSATEDIGKDDK
ncbi:lovastatin nonaketide synthase [Seiridium cupressi]